MRVKICQIKIAFYIRLLLDQARKEFFFDLLLNGKDLPPIDVMPGDYPEEYIILDGRTRMSASADIGEEDIEVNVLPKMSIPEAMAYALKCNFGGPMPPNEEDFIHMADLMIKNGFPRDKILESMSVLPLKMSSRYYTTARKRIIYAQCAKAIDRVARNNETPEAAAVEVSKDDAPVKITGKQVADEMVRRTKKQNEWTGSYGRMRKDMGMRFRVFNTANSKMIKELFTAYSESRVDLKQTKELLGHMGHLISITMKTINEYQKRFEMKSFEFKQPIFDHRVTTRKERRTIMKKRAAAAAGL